MSTLSEDPQGNHFEGLVESARSTLERMAPHAAALPRDGNWLMAIAELGRLSFLLRESRWAAELFDLLAPHAHYFCPAGPPSDVYGPIARYMGELAVILERWDDALTYLDQALEMAQAIDARPHVAHIHYASALALAGRDAPDDRKNAAARVSAALAIAQELGMKPLVEHIVRLKMRLPPGPASPRVASASPNATTIDSAHPDRDAIDP